MQGGGIPRATRHHGQVPGLLSTYPITTSSRVKWDHRDEKILVLVQTEVTRILTSDSMAERMSISRIGKRIGHLPLSGTHLNKMPLKWAMQESEREGLDLQWWRIVRKAGIRGEAADQLRGHFEIKTSLNNQREQGFYG